MTRRVLSLSTLYPNAHSPQFGTFVARSLEALAAREDWDVTVINPIGIPPIALGRYRALAQSVCDGQENGIDVRRPKFTLIPRFGGRVNPGIIARTVLPLAKRLHQEMPFDIVDAQFFYPDGPAAAWLAKQLTLPFSIKARGSDITYWGGKSFAREQMLAAATDADGLLAVSEALAEDMVELGMPREKIAVHYTGLDRDRFRPLYHAGLRAQLGQSLGLPLSNDETLVVTVGTFMQSKGQELVLGAIASLSDARLLLVGKGEDDAHLQSLARDMRIADRVHFLGTVDHDLLPVILSAADVMALPSAREGLANAWVEALACGTPVVIADAGGARELLRSPDAGTIVRREVDAVAAGIKRVMARGSSRQDVAATVEHFDWKHHAAELAAHYERSISR